MKVLEVEACHSSVARALVAKAGGPGFNSLATTKIVLPEGQNVTKNIFLLIKVLKWQDAPATFQLTNI